MLALLDYSGKQELARLLEERERRRKGRKLFTLYPDTGKFRRELYAKHMQFFRAPNRERGMMAANRIGKTEGAGGYETTLHLTGLYPKWWEGKRFNRPVNALVAGDTATTTRDIIQKKLLGVPEGDLGTGLVPFDHVGRTINRSGVPDAYDIVRVRHVLGGWSVLQFRSYDQKRKAFQGTERDVVWLDEEPPEDIYDECLIRTMTTGGIVMVTFTPMEGMTEVALSFNDAVLQ